MAGKATFQGLYRKLNPEQKRAVDAIEGPVMVIAGPGTGKTQILTLRIANILKKTDTAPDNILALTFTESGAFSMRKRLVEIIGSAGYRVRIHTFHGFCNEVIRRFPDSFPRIIGSTHLDDIDKITILKELISETALVRLKPFGDTFYYLHDIRKAISDLKRENISPKMLYEDIAKRKDTFDKTPDLYYTEGKYKGLMRGMYRDMAKKLEKNADLAMLYEQYQQALRERKYYDYEDMVMETISAFECDNDLLLSLQEEFHYLLADEHQDANNSQNRLLELLASFHEHAPNLFIVGDEKQAIFRFQGASLDNFSHFKKRYPEALCITLAVNYRSRRHILDSAHSLIPGSVPLQATSRNAPARRMADERIVVRAFSKTAYEHAFLARDIKEKLDEGVPPREIAVFYRNNSDADPLARQLLKTAVPFVIESAQNVLDDNEIRKFLLILRAVSDFGNDGALISAFHIDFLDIDPSDLYRWIRYARKKRVPPFSVLEREAELKKAGVRYARVLHDKYLMFRAWKKMADNRSLLDLFEIIADESGFVEHVLSKKESNVLLEKVGYLFDDLAKLVVRQRDYRLADYLDYLSLLEEHGITIGKERTEPRDAVRLMTAHKSKGLEFDYVYIIGAYDGHWGNKRGIAHFTLPFNGSTERGKTQNNDDERRLFYVALTRAREGVFISYAKTNEHGGQQLPCQFLEEIKAQYIENSPTDAFEKSVSIDALLRPPKEAHENPLFDKNFLNDLFLEQGFSVTALNNYLRCPWNYFYSNLIRIPKSPSKYMLFGTAMHNALKHYYDALSVDSGVKTKSLFTYFEKELLREPLSEQEYEEMRKKGEAALSGYRPYQSGEGERILSELKVEVHLPTELADAPLLLLRGVLDRVDVAPSGHSVVVTDYKTGKPKSRNVIEGKTKNSDGSYKRQLVFYKLLLDTKSDSGHIRNIQGPTYDMTEGIIDFIEPDIRGKYHQERFVILEKEIEELKKIVQNTAREILDLSFWDTRCDDKKCSFCTLRNLMRA